ncbi:17113_t:CDS:2, partial [Entrophospora sp. SA101]
GNVSQDKLDISKVIFGAGVFSIRYNPIKEVRPLESVHKALKLGINGFDTNPYYGNSEEIL